MKTLLLVMRQKIKYESENSTSTSVNLGVHVANVGLLLMSNCKPLNHQNMCFPKAYVAGMALTKRIIRHKVKT